MIEIITGLPGFGKTLTATNWAYKATKKGKKVYSNYPLKNAEYVHNPISLLGNVKNALIVIDEMGIEFDQLQMYDLPKSTWMDLRQHRKDAVDILGTAQSMFDVAYPLRRLIQFEWNIHFKMSRLVAVTCRNPQRGGDNYGKRFWLLNKNIFDLYDTNHKVQDDLSIDLDNTEEIRSLILQGHLDKQEFLIRKAMRHLHNVA